MSEKQLRITNILLFLILIILIINLVIDLTPLIITGKILSTFSRSKNTTPLFTITTKTLVPGEGSFVITNPTKSP